MSYDFFQHRPGTIFILVGPMGCGKNYVGERIAEQLRYHFVDGDSFISPEMKEKVSRFLPLTVGDIHSFVTKRLIPGIEDALHEHPDGLVVAQALYRTEHRAKIKNYFGDRCQIVLIETDLWTNLKRLFQRDKGLRWVLYGLWNRMFFQNQGFDGKLNNSESE